MNGHVVESTCQLSDFMKAGVMSASERDAGFCSGGDEDDMSGLHSPSASEDSVEVQVTPISLRNKRKLAEPRKIQEPCTAPLKKRRFEQVEEVASVGDEESRPATCSSPSPFRPWSTTTGKNGDPKPQTVPERPPPTDEETRRRHEARFQEEVLLRLREDDIPSASSPPLGHHRKHEVLQRFEPPPPPPAPAVLPHPRLQDEPLALVLRGEAPRVPSHPGVSGSFERVGYPLEHVIQHPNDGQARSQSGQQRNYKNMTRERRIEANARERTRVHTISAAFDTLRRAIPAYSHNQKLSKLSVLRIACSYIMTLSKIANTPEGDGATSPALGACVDLVSRTIQTEGKLRKKKDE
ncbi:carbohydrate-responsive element-binding protein isoform X1 [Neodiprion virginianus]|uniref:carbohydrate-responsive element-binding protein isoform X1 n=2 Tax=Neodiprion virginianus TaxID=2961670 RepID=UPI001EE77F25|nr:carbohydrate-responsive element-binding protein isoform X1 [Neodiprion virginianus]